MSILEDTDLRNVAIQEIEDQLSVLEAMKKNEISVSCFQYAYNSIKGFILEIKKLHSNLRKKASENGLLSDRDFQNDAKALVKWQMNSWNRLNKLKPKTMTSVIKPEQGQKWSFSVQGNIIHDAL